MILRDVTADLRHAIRRLIRTPGFAALAVVMLGIGIGAATSVFSLAYTIWLKPLPYRAPDELVSITSTQRRTGFGSGSSAAELGDIRANVPSFSAVAGYHYSGIFARIDGEPLQLASYPVSVNFFAVLGVEPQLGRGFSPDDEGQPVAILSDDFWRTRLHGDPNVLGRMIGGLEEQVRVVGVMPRDFRFPMQLEADCWSPTLRPTDDRSTRITNLVARLAPGASIDRANAELSALSTRLATAYPASNADWLMRADPFAGAKSTAYRAAFTTLLAMAGLFLLIASANIASLFVARNLTRRHELTVTLAIGAPRWRLARALLVESAILSLAGGALAVLLTAESTHAFARWMPWSTPRLGDLRLNGVVLTFAIAVAACTAALCALAPIAGLRSLRLTESLVGARTIGGASNRGQHTLVIVEIALAAVLLMGGGAMVRSFNDLLNSDRGYVPAGVATMSVSVPYDEARYEAAPARLDAYDQVLASIAKVPGVMAVGAVTGFPGSALGILGSGAVTVPGRTDPPVVAALHSATPDYFRAIGVALKSGRTFTPADRAGGPHVVVISETLERALWPGGRSIGQHFAIPPAGGLMRNGIDDAEVVGVVADMRLSTRRHGRHLRAVRANPVVLGGRRRADDWRPRGVVGPDSPGHPPRESQSADRARLAAADNHLERIRPPTRPELPDGARRDPRRRRRADGRLRVAQSVRRSAEARDGHSPRARVESARTVLVRVPPRHAPRRGRDGHRSRSGARRGADPPRSGLRPGWRHMVLPACRLGRRPGVRRRDCRLSATRDCDRSADLDSAGVTRRATCARTTDLSEGPALPTRSRGAGR